MDPYLTRNLYKEGRHQELMALWENEETREEFGQWDYVNAMNACYVLKDYDQCLEMYRVFHRKFPDSDMLDDKMAWSCYHKYFKDFDFRTGDIGKLKQQAEYILEHSSQHERSPKWFIAKYMIDHKESGDFFQTVSDEDLLRYLDLVDPEKLSLQCDHMTTEDGKDRELASEMEKWYSERTKILQNLKKHEECIACCDRALKRLPSFHSNNDLWFKYRKATALFALGNSDEAREIVKDIRARGLNHWCLYQLLYEIDKKDGQMDNALMHAALCALTDPSHEMRVRFYEELAEDLDAAGLHEEASLHRQQVLLIRKEKEWPLRERHLAWNIPSDIASMNKQETLQKLKEIWTEWRNRNTAWYTGTVTTVLAEGKSGFITAENGKRYYFRSRDMNGNRGIAKEGMKVRFSLADRLDRSKGEVKPNAVQITIL